MSLDGVCEANITAGAGACSRGDIPVIARHDCSSKDPTFLDFLMRNTSNFMDVEILRDGRDDWNQHLRDGNQYSLWTVSIP